MLLFPKYCSLPFGVDDRNLIAVTIHHSYPFSRLHYYINSIEEVTVLSTLDVTSGFWQIEIDESDRIKSSFSFF